MKKHLIVIASIVLLGFSAQAQTNNQAGTLLGFFGAGSTNSTFSALYQGAGDALAFAEGNTNGWARITIEGGCLKTDSQGSGEFANLFIPLSGTNNIFGAGFGVAYLNHNWYDGTVNARLGDTVPLPLGLQKFIPIYAYIESGGGLNLATKQAIAQAFVGASIRYTLFRTAKGNDFDLTAGYAVGTISDISGNVKAIGGSLSWTW